MILQKFNAEQFVNALFDVTTEEEEYKRCLHWTNLKRLAEVVKQRNPAIPN